MELQGVTAASFVLSFFAAIMKDRSGAWLLSLAPTIIMANVTWYFFGSPAWGYMVTPWMFVYCGSSDDGLYAKW